MPEVHRGRRTLASLYAVWTAAIVATAIIASGAVQLWLLYRQTREAVELRQALQAERASASIDRFLEEIGARLRASVAILDLDEAPDEGVVRAELDRLLAESSAIERASWLDRGNRERYFATRLPTDGKRDAFVLDDASLRAGISDIAPRFGTVVFHRGGEPSVVLSLRGRRPNSGTVAVQLSMKQVSEVVAAIRFGQTGSAYVVDRDGNLLAHRDLQRVLTRTNWADRPQVRAALDDPISLSAGGSLIEATDDDGRPVVARAAKLVVPAWVLITEQARDEAYAPIGRSLGVALALLALAVGAGIGAGSLLGLRVVRPIGELAEGARRIGLGRLDHRIVVTRNDEIGQLGMHFNRMAERLSESYATLGAKVRQRTAELARANRELQARKDEAERASLAKTRFLAAASHDLRQPMHTLSLLVGVLQQRITYPEVSRIVASIQASSEAMENLLNSLLDISKLDAGIVKPSVRECALGEVLRLVELHYRPFAVEKGLRLTVVPTRCVVFTDAALLERVVYNLVSNAITYTAHGKVLVGCRRYADQVELQVWDTGAGIAPEHREDIFEEFFQLANPERDRSKGLGLGLSIVKRTLDLLGHPIRLRSQPGRGSCFSIALPLARVPTPSSRPVAKARRGDRVAGAFVLIIDDEAAAREAMEALCREWGAHVLGGASADECIERLAEHLRPPDLILCDYRLRDREDGVAAIRRIRRHCESSIPAIIVTGDIAAADLGRVAAAGLAVLHKPVSPDRLLHAIETALAPRPIEGCGEARMGPDLPTDFSRAG